MSYNSNNNQYPYYPSNTYNQTQSSSAYGNGYANSNQSNGQTQPYYPNDTYRASNANQYGANTNQAYNAAGASQQQGSSNIPDSQSSASIAYIGSYGNTQRVDYSGGTYASTAPAQAGAMSYAAPSGRSSPTVGYNSRMPESTATSGRGNNYAPATGFQQSASRSTTQSSTSMPQYSTYSTAQDTQSNTRSSNQPQQSFTRPHQPASQHASGATSSTGQAHAPSTSTGRTGSYASPTMATNPQLAQSYNKNAPLAAAHSRSGSGLSQTQPSRPKSTTQQRKTPVPRPSSTDPSIVQSTMQQLANVPWQGGNPYPLPQPPATQTAASVDLTNTSEEQAISATNPAANAASENDPELLQALPKKKGGRPPGAKDVKPRKKKSSLGAQASPGQHAGSSTALDQDTELKAMFEKMAQLRQTDPNKFAQLLNTFQKPDTETQSVSSIEPQPVATSTPQAPFNAAAATAQPSSVSTQRPSPASKKGNSAKRNSAQTQPAPSFVDVTDPKSANAQALSSPYAIGQAAIPGSLPAYVPASTSAGPLAGPMSTQASSPSIRSSNAPQASNASTATALKSPPIQPLPASATSSGHEPAHWPAGRRQGLAAAAKKYLEAIPENRGKIVNPDRIHELLNQNPSYEKLCQIMEGQGWKFTRSDFAIELMAALKRGTQPGSRPAATANTSRPVMSPPNTTIKPGDYHVHPGGYQHRPYQAAAHLADHIDPRLAISSATTAPTAVVTASTAAGATPGIPHFVDVTGSTSTVAAQERAAASKPASRSPSVAKPVASPSVPTPAPEPRNKEEAARKRTFADFIDLTEQEEDDDVELELERERKRQALEKPADRFADKAPVEGPSPWQQAAQRFDRFRSQPVMTGMTSARDALRNETVVQPINAARAKRTSRYDPRTIARDFFLAKGEHPTMKPLNQHFEALFNTFRSVKIDSDLETFRWDLVDPGDPIPDPERDREQAARNAITEGNVDRSSAQPMHEHGQTHNSGYNAESDSDEEVVGILIPPSQAASDRNKQTSAKPSNHAPRSESQSRDPAPSSRHYESDKVQGSGSRRSMDESRPKQVVTGVKVPSVPTDFRFVQAYSPENARPGSGGRSATPDSISRYERDPVGRPPKRGRGRPSRGSYIPHRGSEELGSRGGPGSLGTTSTSTRQARVPSPHHRSFTPQPGPTPQSFTPINRSRAPAADKGTSFARNAIDDISTGLTASVETPSPGRGRTSKMATPSSFSVVIPSNSATPLDKHGNPAKVSSTGKRVGRPPGSKNKPGLSASDTGSPSVKGSSEAPVKRKPGRPVGYRPSIHGRGPGAGRGIGRGRGRGRGRVRAASAGRPRAYKRPTTFHRDWNQAVVIPQLDLKVLDRRLSHVEPLIVPEPRDRKWGKDDSQHHRHVTEYPDTNQFPVFRCKWHACTSQLHNFETLQKHVDRIHLKRFNLDPTDTPECLWYGCCDDSYYAGQVHEHHAAVSSGTQFEHLAELESHIAAEHLNKIVWKQGDGPTVHPKIHDPRLYLNDPQTQRTVVPLALRPGAGPPDPLLDLSDPTIPRENRVQFIKAYHKAHGNTTKASKARAVLLSRRAWAEDEDRLSLHNQDPRKWRQMNMTGVRVEVPLSEEAKLRLGLRDGDVAAWRDGDWQGANLGNGDNNDEDDDDEDEDEDSGDSDTEMEGQESATMLGPGRAGSMGTGMLAPQTIMATGSTTIPDSDDSTEDDQNPMIMITSPGRSGTVGTGMLSSKTIAASGPAIPHHFENDSGSEDGDAGTTTTMAAKYQTAGERPSLSVPRAPLPIHPNEALGSGDEDEDSSDNEAAARRMLNKPQASSVSSSIFAARPRQGQIASTGTSLFTSGAAELENNGRNARAPAQSGAVAAARPDPTTQSRDSDHSMSSEDDYYDAPPITARQGEQ